MNEQRSTFQNAIAVVEALPVKKQTMLVEIINNRLKKQQRAELIAEVKIAEQEYAAGDFKRDSAANFMADLHLL
jgi:hypothetical protein